MDDLASFVEKVQQLVVYPVTVEKVTQRRVQLHVISPTGLKLCTYMGYKSEQDGWYPSGLIGPEPLDKHLQ